jgi:hypothetical protein
LNQRKYKKLNLFLTRMKFRNLLALIIFLFGFSFSQLLAQTEPNYDTNYIQSYHDNLIITLVRERKNNLVYMSFNTPSTLYELDYQTNDPLAFGIGIDYKWFTFEYTTKMPWTKPDDSKGKVDNFGIGFGLTYRRLAFRNFFERNKGYFLNNTDAWLPSIANSPNPYYLRPDIETHTYFSSLNYTFNYKHFSNNAALWQLERQKKRAGSLVLGLSYIFNSFYADSSIVPTTGIDTFPRNNNTYFSLNAIGVNTGFVGTLPFFKSKKWFLSGALIPGISYQFGHLTIEDLGAVKAKKLIGVQSEFRIAVGYNGDKYYAGLSYRAYGNVNAVNKQDPMNITNTFGRVYFGYRFDPPKIRNKFLKKIGL